jgi:hypothetical protein
MKLLYDQPMYVPAGSIRAFIALALVLGYMLGVVAEDLLFLVLGFYFGQRSGETP